MKKKRSIKVKLTFTIIPVVSILLLILVGLSYSISSKMLQRDANDLLESSVKSQATRIESWLNENLSAFQTAKKTIETTNPSPEQLPGILDGYYKFDSDFPDGLFIADNQGHFYKANQSTIEVSNPTSEIWFKEGMTHVNMAFGTPHKQGNEEVISASGIINTPGDPLKVIAGNLTLDRVSTIVNSFISMKGANAFLYDQETQKIVADREKSFVSQVLGQSNQPKFYQNISKELKDNAEVSLKIDGNLAVSRKINGTNWVLVSYIPEKVILSGLSKLRLIMVVISVFSVLALGILIERMTNRVVKPVKDMTSVIKTMADGDFTVSVNNNGDDEIAEMGHSIEGFIQYMRNMIQSITHISSGLQEQAKTSEMISRDMYDASESQSVSMDELNNTVDQLSLSVNDIAENAMQLAQIANDTKQNSNLVEEKMNETVEISEKGRSEMQQVVQAMQNIQHSINDLESSIGRVGTASSQIVQIIQIIGEIAHQTNLLSINASLEAARAGEAGKGFAVVATEINKLAKNSADSVSQITNLISEVNTLVEEAVMQANHSSDDILNSSQLIRTAVDSFDSIFQNIQQTNQLIQDVVDKIDLVDQVATNAAAISEEQAASSDEIHATSETTLTQAKHISNHSKNVATEAHKLADSSQQLANQVKRFKV
ncbi:methyl-accepting chemotaxis protein [uncultured Enterococcus sp.]|uniref:methyl-accepting chemotaxis protein n=1 Tax=uncultured Enterococcus sp. TaxID=167972 RepID=UPI002618084A|nr:methyl-accepting chemotaxis protein [uncultured Enterococcus sp.]